MVRTSVLLVSLFLMATVAAFGQNMQKGDFKGDVSAEGWALASGSGSRSHIIFVNFNKPFDTTPTVMVSLTGYDGSAGKDGNFRVAITPEKVTRDGFVVKVQTWADSKINAVYGSWIAWGK